MDSLAIVIPFYNESACLPGLIEELDDLMAKIDTSTTVLAINDGSKDSTLELLRSYAKDRSWLQIIDQKNGGHGVALRKGYDMAIAANYDWVFQCDSDRQIPVIEIFNFWKIRQSAQFFLGVRTNRQDPGERLFISNILRYLLKILFGANVQDANCPFRLIKTSQLKNALAFIPKKTFAPNVFLSVFANKTTNYQEVFVSHLPRKAGENSINRMNLLKICLRCIRELIRFWYTRKLWNQNPNTLQSFL